MLGVVQWIVAGTREYPLAAGEHVIGADRGAALCLESLSVSRRHARITVTADGARVEDLGSRTGTFVNGQALLRTRRLHSGDRLTIGDVEVVYHAVSLASPEGVSAGE
jgi:two-component system, NtrC family, response regulator AtoC